MGQWPCFRFILYMMLVWTKVKCPSAAACTVCYTRIRGTDLVSDQFFMMLVWTKVKCPSLHQTSRKSFLYCTVLYCLWTKFWEKYQGKVTPYRRSIWCRSEQKLNVLLHQTSRKSFLYCLPSIMCRPRLQGNAFKVRRKPWRKTHLWKNVEENIKEKWHPEKKCWGNLKQTPLKILNISTF